MEISFPDSPRIGRFNILSDKIDDPHSQALFSLCTVLHEEPHESGRGTTFYAASDLFQPLNEGEEIPEYRIESVFDGNFEREDYQHQRIDSGRFGFVAIRNTIIRVPTLGIQTTVH